MPIVPIQYQETTQFQPTSNFLAVMKMKQDIDNSKAALEEAKLRNRLMDMQLKEAETGKKFKDEVANSLLVPQTSRNVSLTGPSQLTQVPLASPGGVLGAGQRTPSGGISENTPAAPAVPGEKVALPPMTPEQYASPEMQEVLNSPAFTADVQDKSTIPLLERGKAFGLSEAVLRQNPAAALDFIEKKEAEQQALMDKKINMIKDINTVNPNMAANLWNSDPVLSKQGKMEVAANGEVQEVKVDGEVIGYNIRKPDGKYEYRDAGNNTVNDFKTFYKGYKQEHPGATDAQVSRAWHAMKMDESKQRMQFSVTVAGEKDKARTQSQGSFSSWTPEDKAFWFDQQIATGAPTVRFGFGDRKSWNDYNKEFAAYARDQGVTGEDQVVAKADYKGLTSSLAQQQKNAGMMGSFVSNLNKQVDRVDAVGNDIVKRVGVRALDMPIRKLKTEFIGSGNENILAAYTVEISNEIGKLSTGSAASIRELSVEAQARWAKIHDPNLSLRQLEIILNETKAMGNMRMESVNEEIQRTKELLRGKKGSNSSAQGSAKPKVDLSKFWKK